MSTIKPSDTYDWATAVGATSDPGSIRRGTGFVTGKKPPAKWFNFLHRGAALWFKYLDQLHADDAFLGPDYAWTGQHTFSQEHRFATSKPYSRILDLHPARPLSSDASTVTWLGEDWQWAAGNAGSFLYIPVALPTNAFVTGLKLLVEGTTGHDVSAAMRRASVSFDAATIGGFTSFRSVSSVSLVNGLITIDVPSLVGQSALINRDVTKVDIAVSINNGGTPAVSKLRAVRVDYEMPGYRNG
jgi:hypothetical protein